MEQDRKVIIYLFIYLLRLLLSHFKGVFIFTPSPTESQKKYLELLSAATRDKS